MQARRTERPRGRALGHIQLDVDEHADQFFCRDFLHNLDLEITLGDELLQPRILRLELLGDARRLPETPEAFAPRYIVCSLIRCRWQPPTPVRGPPRG